MLVTRLCTSSLGPAEFFFSCPMLSVGAHLDRENDAGSLDPLRNQRSLYFYQFDHMDLLLPSLHREKKNTKHLVTDCARPQDRHPPAGIRSVKDIIRDETQQHNDTETRRAQPPVLLFPTGIRPSRAGLPSALWPGARCRCGLRY
jgi:hypothetical protein